MFKTLLNHYRYIILVIVISSGSLKLSAQSETFSSGSFIINMGATNPNTAANGLKPYGLMYDLIRNYNVPIKWVISQTKVKDGIDFTYNGVQYKGGTFIIPAEYRSAGVNARITYWTGLGVVGSTTAAALTLDVTVTITAIPKWTLDSQNGSIAEQFLISAGITNTAFPGAYNWKLPAALDCCDDYFVMPHADPTWATHGHLWAWNKDCLGSVWAGCHAVSVLEGLVNPSDATQKMTFLSTTGLLLFGSHSGGSIPYTQQLPTDPIAQYLGATDLAQQNGSEQIYMPKAGGAWRPTTKIIAYDPTQTNVPANSPGPAAVIVYGRGMGDNTRGYVMYEASHNINGGTANSIAAVRAFLNFSFFQTTPKSPHLTVVGITAGQQITGGASVTGLNVTASSPLAGITFTYQWTTSCGGTFSNPTGTTTNFTAPAVGANTNCIITCKVTDNCGRVSFNSYPIIILAPPAPPIAVADSRQIDNSCLSSIPSITFHVLDNDSDPLGTPISFTGLNQPSASPANAGVWTSSPDGTVVFTPDPNFSGTATIQYTIQNAAAITATATITVIVGQADIHGCTPSNVWGVSNTDFINNTSIVAVGNAAGITGELITDPSMDDQEGTFTTAATDYIDMGTTVGSNYIDLQLPFTLNLNDTVVIHWGKKTNNGTTAIGARQSATSTFSGATTNYSVTGAGNQPTDTRYPIAANGMNYIRLQVGTGTTQNLYIDAVEYELWSCVTRVPNVNGDAVVDLEDAISVISVLGNDVDPAGGTLTVSGIVTQPAHGKVSVNLDNTITYIPNPDYKLTDYFIYRACTSDGYCDTARVTITISPDACAVGSYSPIPAAGATTTTFTAVRDNFLKQNSANSVQGGNTLSVGFTPNNQNRAVLYFDLSTIPVGSIVTSATFQAYRTAGNNNTQFFTNHKLNTGLFVENQVTWNNWSTGNAWPVAGGGNFSAREDSVSVTSTKKYYFWNAGNMAQAWVNTPANNYGMLLKGAGILNKNHTFSDRTVANKQPKLTVTYIVPAPCAIIPVNRAPLANPDTVLTDRATPVTISPLANDDDINGFGTISLAAATPVISATGGSYTILGNTITYTPAIPGSPGMGTITYRVQDAGGLYDTSIIYIRIANAPPNAVNDLPAGALSGIPQSFNVGTNDSDPEGASLVYGIYRDGKNGNSTIAGSTVTYTPNTGFTGKDTVYYQVAEPILGCSNGLKDSAYVVFIVNNRPPTANDDTKSVLPCLATTFNLISNDTDPENGVLAVNFVSGLSNPAAGTLVNNNDGTVTFTPAPGFLGIVTFTYTVADNGTPPLVSGGVTTVTINVTNPVNTAPVAGNDTEAGPMDQVIYSSVLDNDSDPENQNLTTPVITVAPLHGTAIVLANGLVKYTPNPGFFGTDILTYRICDQVINPATCVQVPTLCTTATLSITISVPNTVVAINDENSTWINTPVSGGVMSNDWDPQGDTKLFNGFISGGSSVLSGPITVSGVDASGNPVANAGTLSINSNGTYTFTPANNFTGIVTVPYTILDNNINPADDTAYLKITVSPVMTLNNSVIANNDENISYGSPVGGNLLLNDRDPQNDAFVVTGFTYDTDGDGSADGTGTIGTPFITGGITTTGLPTANAGTLTLQANGTYTFTPAPDFHGHVDVPYTICDNGVPVACATAILHIDVLPDINGPSNDPPVAGDDFGYTSVNKPVTGSFIGNDSDPNGDPVSYLGVTIVPGGPATPIGGPVATAQGGTIQFYANGTYLYTPPAGYIGPDILPYTICDVTAIAPQPLCSNATIHLLVGAGINIAGRVWDDANGNVIINGGENGTNASNALYVNLVDGSGNVVATTTVAADGTYSFSNINPGANYSLVLSTTQGTVGQPAPAAGLPANWVNIGENRNGVIDGGTLGVIDTRSFGYTNTINFDFGIEQLPNTDDHTTNIAQPVAGTMITLNGGANPPALSGIDPEDCNAGCSMAGHSVIIDAVPANSELYYNGVLVINGQQINNFNPSLLQVKFTATTLLSTSTSFLYSFVDAAGKKDPTPATYTLTWLNVVPVVLSSFTGTPNKCDAVLQWKTSTEINADKFVVEQSSNGLNFAPVAEVRSAGNSTGKTYHESVSQPSGTMYYRLKLLDRDGRFTYSPVVNVRTSCGADDYLAVYPNPVSSGLTVSFHTSYKGAANLVITNAVGQKLFSKKVQVTVAANTINLDLSNYTPGMYMLFLADDSGVQMGEPQKVIKN